MEILQRPAVGVIAHCEYDDRDLKGRKNALFFFFLFYLKKTAALSMMGI